MVEKIIEKLCAAGHVIGPNEERCGRCGGGPVNSTNDNNMTEENSAFANPENEGKVDEAQAEAPEAQAPAESAPEAESAPASEEAAPAEAPAEAPAPETPEAPAEGSSEASA